MVRQTMCPVFKKDIRIQLRMVFVREGEMANILRFEKDKYIIEIESFNQRENGGTGTTYTLYPYPHGLFKDFDINNVESFDDLRKAIKKAKKILNI